MKKNTDFAKLVLESHYKQTGNNKKTTKRTKNNKYKLWVRRNPVSRVVILYYYKYPVFNKTFMSCAMKWKIMLNTQGKMSQWKLSLNNHTRQKLALLNKIFIFPILN